MTELLPYIADKIEKFKVRHDIHTFDSEAIMIDIWVDNKFYVVQLDGAIAGLSLVTNETTPFDVIPEHSFNDINEFKNAFDNIFALAGVVSGKDSITVTD